MSEYTLEALDECREKIDELDLQLISLFNERARIVDQIGAIKRALKLAVYEPRREQDVLRNVLEHNSGPLDSEAVRRLFERIMDEMRTLQKNRMRQVEQAGAHSGPKA